MPQHWCASHYARCAPPLRPLVPNVRQFARMVPTPSPSVRNELFEEVPAAFVKYRFNDVGAPLAGRTAVAPVLDEPRMLTDSRVATAAVSIDNSAANLLISVVGRGAAACPQT